MTTVSSQHVKIHLAQLLDRVSNGEEILITRRGLPVAVLTPPSKRAADITNVIKQMKALRKGNVLGKDVTIRELIEEGRP